jgi:hypothetical protein
MRGSSPHTHRPAGRVAPSVLAIALCALGACAPPDRAAATWRAFAPEGAGFSVLLPGVPERQHEVARGERQSIETDVYTLDLPAGGFYSVVVSRLPKRAEPGSETDRALDSAVERAVASASARLVSKQTVFLGGQSGRQVEADVPESAVAGGGTLRGRVFVSGERLYEVIAVVPRTEAGSPATARFLESFELTAS